MPAMWSLPHDEALEERRGREGLDGNFRRGRSRRGQARKGGGRRGEFRVALRTGLAVDVDRARVELAGAGSGVVEAGGAALRQGFIFFLESGQRSEHVNSMGKVRDRAGKIAQFSGIVYFSLGNGSIE